MEQRSDVEYRAEKLYKNSREKFGYLIREVVSNSIHAVVVKKKLKEHSGYIPRVEISIVKDNSSVRISVSDNGDGFNDLNRKCFTHLDFRNPEKEKLKFHPKGQGRLTLVYFSDQSKYSSIYVDQGGVYQKISFHYPEKSVSLFDIDDSVPSLADKSETGTNVDILIFKPQSVGRANTFLTKYHDVEKLRDWFIENFFPFFMEEEDLQLVINYGDSKITLDKRYIDRNIKSIHFSVDLDGVEAGETDFYVWLVELSGSPKSRNPVICFARHLRADIDGAKIEYEIDLPKSYEWFLVSEYFDNNVDQKGDKIEIDEENVEKIQLAMNDALDNEFRKQIEINRTATRKNIRDAMEKFHSLAVFIEDADEYNEKKILKESDIVGNAVEVKGRVEKNYWINPAVDSDDVGRLLNSSLQIYIDHRSRVLDRFKEMILLFDEGGDKKTESEDDIHDLFLRRGSSLKDSNNRVHLHNLWILDDKYTIFSEASGASSSKRGQKASDIYIWTDDPERARELLILELKSTSHAHNAGDKHESMVAQVKRYASQFFRDPKKILNWDVDPHNVLYSGFILARKSDVNKELNSNNSGAVPSKIPYLESSYYFNEKFSVTDNLSAAPVFVDIRIEMYSYEDIYKLALARNSVFFRLLKGEFRVPE